MVAMALGLACASSGDAGGSFADLQALYSAAVWLVAFVAGSWQCAAAAGLPTEKKICLKRYGCGNAPAVGGVKATWIPEVTADDSRLFTHFLAKGQPVIVRDAPLSRSSIGTWTPEAFDKHWPDALKLHAFLSRNRYVSYHNPGESSPLYGFTAPVSYAHLSWTEARHLADRMTGTSTKGSQGCLMANEVASIGTNTSENCREEYCRIDRICSVYLFADGQKFQELVRQSKTLGDAHRAWDWQWLEKVRTAAEWVGPAYGMGTAMVVAQRDSTMTPHFDSHGNIVLQLHGEKDVVLWPPEDTPGLYPFPSNHAATRQAMLNPESFPRFMQGDRFPRYVSTRPQRGVLRAGDALYIPLAWWHLMRTSSHLGISVSYWHDSKRPGPYSPPPASLRGAGPKVLAKHTALLWFRLEAVVKEAVGDDNLNEAMVALSQMRQPKEIQGFHKALEEVKTLLLWLFKEDPVRAGKFVEEMVASRFGVDHDRSVHIWYAGDAPVSNYAESSLARDEVIRPSCAGNGTMRRENGSLCIVAPLRRGSNGDITNLLQLYARYFHSFLEDQRDSLAPHDYKILVVEQVDDFLLNRASLFNVGADFLGDCCGRYIFGDIDMLPMDGTELALPLPPAGPQVLHLSRELWGYSGANTTDDRVFLDLDEKPLGDYYRDQYFGGVVYITREALEEINGFSNSYWGWGGEDDDFRLRAVSSGLISDRIPRPAKGKGVWRHIDLARRPGNHMVNPRYSQNIERMMQMVQLVKTSIKYKASSDRQHRDGGDTCQQFSAKYAMWNDGLSTVQYRSRGFKQYRTHSELQIEFQTDEVSPIIVPWEGARATSVADCSAYGLHATPPARSTTSRGPKQ